MRTVHFITHPEVAVDPTVPVPQWPLSERGRQRMRTLVDAPWIDAITAIYSSAERKALDGAAILAQRLRVPVQTRDALGENDRSSTGFLPSAEFEATADRFFAHPAVSVRGWETAAAAQKRIVAAVDALLATDGTPGDIAIVSHGAVGTLLLCHLAGWAIDRRHDQPGAGGGNRFAFTVPDRALIHGWRPIDTG